MFFSYPELNKAILNYLPELAHREFQKRVGSRYSEFIRVDKPALRPLPAFKYELADIKKKCVGDNYHLEYDGFYYSVPYTLHNVPRHIIINTNDTIITSTKSEATTWTYQDDTYINGKTTCYSMSI